MRYLVGVDEVGRGPLAGPVAVGAVLISPEFDWTLIENVRDSKRLSEKMRERVYVRAQELAHSGLLRFSVATSSANYIDRYGIVPAIQRALEEALTRFAIEPSECRILLDGALRAPARYPNQVTIIRGDVTEPVISLASIMAKVTRDRLMVSLARKYPAYGFEVHKGYGTLRHRQKIEEAGYCDLHRTTFCRNLQSGAHSV